MTLTRSHLLQLNGNLLRQDVAQLVASLPGMYETLGLIFGTTETGIMVHACNSSTLEGEAD